MTDNGAEDGGGVAGSTLYNCMLANNRCGREGGGAEASTLYNCILTGNLGGSNGGGAWGSRLYNCTLTGNHADRGGGAYLSTLYNCLVTGNSARVGGGGAFLSTLYNCTLSENSSSLLAGGGVSMGTLYTCIVFFNTAPDGPNYDSSSTFSYSCTTPLPSSGAGNTSDEPGFVNLAAGDFHLKFGSPCINAGINQDWMIGATDLDGNPRISGGTVDMGAYEFPLSSGGFVTGGGWIDSPLGAFYPGVVGTATFGFAAHHLKGAIVPTGDTQFKFGAGNLDFTSTGYNKLIVAGARAQFKGSGTINGQGNFRFTLKAIDGQLNGGDGSDRFRIKIWDDATSTIVYDNQSGGADTAELSAETIIQRGSVVIHKP